MNSEVYKNIYKKKIKTFENNECYNYLQKNGKIKYFRDINYRYKRYLCILKNILKFDGFVLSLVGKNEDDIVENLILLNYLRKKNLKYYILKKKDDIIFVFKEKNKDFFLNILFFLELLDNNKFNIENIQNINNINLINVKKISNKNKLLDLLRLLSIEFLLYKSKYINITNQEVLIYLFYKIYILIIEKELKKKFNLTLHNFENYHFLYIFLKEKGYVDIFYNNYGPIIINNQKNIYKYILNHPNLQKFKIKFENNKSLIKNFSEIDLNYLIDKKMYQNFNKDYIKNKFMKLTKKI